MLEDKTFLINMSMSNSCIISDIVDDVVNGIGRNYNYENLESIGLNNQQKEYIEKVLKDIYKLSEAIYETLIKIGDKNHE